MRVRLPRDLRGKLLVYGVLVTLPGTVFVAWLEMRAAQLSVGPALAVHQALNLLLVALLIVPLWVFLQRKVLRPVRLVMDADRLPPSASLSARLVPEDRLPDHEIGDMIRSRNAMLRQIEELQSVFRRNLRHLAALSSTAAQLAKPEEFDRFLEQVLNHVLEASAADAAQVSVLDPKGQGLTVRICRGFSEKWIREEATCPTPECLCGQALATRQPIVVANLTEDPRATRIACQLDGFQAYIGVPLICGDRVAGVMAALRRAQGFSPQEVDSLAAIGYLLGLALENARLLHETRQLAITDSLTGVYTRRYFFERLEDEHRRCVRTGRPFAVVMVDLDGYKAYNDRHGHLTGDRVLQQVAECLTQTVRQSDIVARYGGDEFVILLPETSKAEAVVAAERVHHAIQRLSLPVAPAGESPGGLRASFGVAAYPEDGLEAELLVARADAALYRAKAEGGARVVGWSYPKES